MRCRWLVRREVPARRPPLSAAGRGPDRRWHVDQIGLFDRAANDGDVLLTAEAEFSMLLAARGTARPSVVLLRHVAELPWRDHQALLLDNLHAVLEDLQGGAVVSLSPTRLAVRRLPISGERLSPYTPAEG